MMIQFLYKSTFGLLILLAAQTCLVLTQTQQKTKLPDDKINLSNLTKLDVNQTNLNQKYEEKEEFYDEHSNQPHSRKKRLIWVTDDGRLALPPGTSLTISPTIGMPLVRYPPEGFFSNLSISFPVTIDFDKLGLTDNQNPLGDLPPIFARSFGRGAGQMLGSYISKYIHFRKKRDLANNNMELSGSRNFHNFKIEHSENLQPELPERFKHIFHGGERVLLYGIIEDFLGTFGMNGQACLLRTICEVHSRQVDHFGVFGEMTKLFLTAKKSPFADLIPDYVRAQEIGEGKVAPGECFPYYKDCPKSIFKALQNRKYSSEKQSKNENDFEEEEVEEIITNSLKDAHKTTNDNFNNKININKMSM